MRLTPSHEREAFIETHRESSLHVGFLFSGKVRHVVQPATYANHSS